MTVLPVIERELREATRRPWTVWVRMWFALVGLAYCAVVLGFPNLSASEQSQVMLVGLGMLGFVFALFSGCFLTADSVSREKRDGTLGLLFLTPLRSWEIAGGKLVCGSVQVFYGVLAVVPVFFLPLLIGGVTWAEVLRVLFSLLVTFLLSLSAGLFFSVLSVESRRPVSATLFFMLLLAFVPVTYVFIFEALLRVSLPTPFPAQPSPLTMFIHAFDFAYRARGAELYWPPAVFLTLVSAALLAGSVWLLPRMRFEPGIGKPRPRLQPGRRRSRSDLAGLQGAQLYERIAGRSDGNGLGTRLTRWALLGLFGFLLCISVTTSRWEVGYISAFCVAYAIHALTKFQIVLDSTRVFHEDLRSGALELILSTPLRQRDVVAGARSAIRRAHRSGFLVSQFANLLLLGAAIVFYDHLNMGHGALEFFSVAFVGGVIQGWIDREALEAVGLLHGLRSASHPKAVLATYVRVMLPSWVCFGIAVALCIVSNDENTFGTVMAVWVLCSALYSGVWAGETRWQLARSLRRWAAGG